MQDFGFGVRIGVEVISLVEVTGLRVWDVCSVPSSMNTFCATNFLHAGSCLTRHSSTASGNRIPMVKLNCELAWSTSPVLVGFR